MGELSAAWEPCDSNQLGPLVTASVLLTDKSDNVLLVRSVGDHSWTMPSSLVTGDETPHDCVERLASQQLGLTAIAGRLLVISWIPATDQTSPAVVDLLFDGGAVYNEAALSAGAGAAGLVRFFSWEHAETEVSATLARCLSAARDGREGGGTAYIH